MLSSPGGAAALLVLRDHLRRCLTRAARDQTAADPVVEEAMSIFDRATRL
jgi:DNA-binding FrmR family transcriptional regulator